MHSINCGEIWGGIYGRDLDVCTSGIEASLFSSACMSGKGGDIYYISVCGSDLLTKIAIADVTGHGQEVSETSQCLYDSLKNRMNEMESNLVLCDMNNVAVEYGFNAITTAAIATFSRINHFIYFSYAGHHPILVKDSVKQQWSNLELPSAGRVANVPLGISKDLPYDIASQKVNKGDLLFLYTDGVVEAKNSEGELFGESKLLAVLNAASNNIKAIEDSVLTALLEHTGDKLEHDDVTFMAIRIREEMPE